MLALFFVNYEMGEARDEEDLEYDVCDEALVSRSVRWWDGDVAIPRYGGGASMFSSVAKVQD